MRRGKGGKGKKALTSPPACKFVDRSKALQTLTSAESFIPKTADSVRLHQKMAGHE